MKLKYSLLLLLWPLLTAGQVKPLNVGDTVPDIVFTNVINYPVSKIHLSDLKGKLVILDFWSTWCGACIEAFPKMHELQEEFGDQIQVILINTYEGDDVKKVKSFFEKRKLKTGQRVDLPYSLMQSSLSGYFPYKFVPHYVWIDKEGKILATTSPFEVTKENIRSAIQGRNNNLHIKADILDFDRNKPLFAQGNGGTDPAFVFRSILTEYKEGLGGSAGIQKDSAGECIRLYAINYPLNSLLRIAYREIFDSSSSNQVIVQKNAQSVLLNENFTSARSRYNSSFCYDLLTPPVSLQEILKYFQEDMYRAFHVKVKKEERKMKCLVLAGNSRILKTRSRLAETNVIQSRENMSGNKDNFYSVSEYAKLLNEHTSFRDLFVMDGTNSKEKIRLQVPGTEISGNDIMKFLKSQGFNVREEYKSINVAVIYGN